MMRLYHLAAKLCHLNWMSIIVQAIDSNYMMRNYQPISTAELVIKYNPCYVVET